jgi:hypothetical protein
MYRKHCETFQHRSIEIMNERTSKLAWYFR